MTLPNTSEGWAIHLSKMLDAIHSVHENINRFPINVAEISKEYSKKVFPKESITFIQGDSFSDAFEGALIPCPARKGEWGILYNNTIKSKGRINFTLAHELGHYLLHRHKLLQGKNCTRQDMWQSRDIQIEHEANTFASCFLMPALDVSKQIFNTEISKDLILHLVDRYEVSIVAAALRWLELCKNRAMIISSKDGFIDWAWSSQRLIKSRIYYAPKQHVIELPINSLASGIRSAQNERVHSKGVWAGNEEVKELLLYRNEDSALSLLVYPQNDSSYNYAEEDTKELDGALNFSN